MDEYKQPYLTLFNAVTDAIRLLDEGSAEAAMAALIDGQSRAEAQFISQSEK